MKLDIYQEEIVKSTAQHIVVVSGAGSGKTRVLTERIKWLIEQGNDPKKIVAITFTNFAADEMRERLGDICKEAFIGTTHSYANRLLIKNGYDTSAFIKNDKFDKFFEAIEEHPEVIEEVDFLLVDEYQDVNANQISFFEMINAKNTFVVGDDWQCQPAGTKVRLRNNVYKNIEDIEVGDSVIWYDPNKSYTCGPTTKTKNSIEKKVLKIANREFKNDELITITTEGNKQTIYTPNHITYVKLNETDYNHVVYLMCDRNYRFRIGKIPFVSKGHKGLNPWRQKMFNEGCEKIWLLDVFKTDKEARLLETKLSYQYQIPQTCWQTNKVTFTKEDIDYIYDGLDTKKNAEECLKAFHKDINYPLIDISLENTHRIHFATNAVAEINACNIIPKVMSCLVYDEKEKKRKRYEIIDEIDYIYINSDKPIKVYSLEVEGGSYVADDIITHNCIFTFSGSDPQYFKDAAADPKNTVYYLKNNYRTPRKIVKFATEFLRPITNKIKKTTSCQVEKEGILEEVYDDLPRIVREIEKNGEFGKWFVLTRSNEQITEVMNILQHKKIPCDTFKKSEAGHEDIQRRMKEDTVKVLTIHSAKGLENDYVAVYRMSLGERVKEEERFVAYVAATRARKRLIWCYWNSGNKKRKPQIVSWEN